MKVIFKNTDRVKIHYTFGQCDSITVPIGWRRNIEKQKQILHFYKIYDAHKYLRDMIGTGNIDLVDFALNNYQEVIKSEGIYITDEIFKLSYPKIFEL